MSVKDVCELSSMLHGDDSERIDLGRRLLALESALDQQKLRLNHEIEQKRKEVSKERMLFTKSNNLNDKIDSLTILLTQISNDGRLESDRRQLISRIVSYELNKNVMHSELENLKLTVRQIDKHTNELKILRNEHASSELELLRMEEKSLEEQIRRSAIEVSDRRDAICELESTVAYCDADISEKSKSLYSEEDSCNTLESEIMLSSALVTEELPKFENTVKTLELYLQVTCEDLRKTLRDVDDVHLDIAASNKQLHEQLEMKYAAESLNIVHDSLCHTREDQLTAKVSANSEMNLLLRNQEQLNAVLLSQVETRGANSRIEEEELKLLAYEQRHERLSLEVEKLNRDLEGQATMMKSIRDEIAVIRNQLNDCSDNSEYQQLGFLLLEIEQSEATKRSLFQQLQVDLYPKQTVLHDSISRLQASDVLASDSIHNLLLEKQELMILESDLSRQLEDKQRQAGHFAGVYDNSTLESAFLACSKQLEQALAERDDIERKRHFNTDQIATYSLLETDMQSRLLTVRSKYQQILNEKEIADRSSMLLQRNMRDRAVAIEALRHELTREDSEFQNLCWKFESDFNQTQGKYECLLGELKVELESLIQQKEQLVESINVREHKVTATSPSATSESDYVDSNRTIFSGVKIDHPVFSGGGSYSSMHDINNPTSNHSGISQRPRKLKHCDQSLPFLGIDENVVNESRMEINGGKRAEKRVIGSPGLSNRANSTLHKRDSSSSSMSPLVSSYARSSSQVQLNAPPGAAKMKRTAPPPNNSTLDL